MSSQPRLVFCVRTDTAGRCLLQEILSKAATLCGREGFEACRVGLGRELYRPVLAAKLLYTNQASPTLVEAWLRVSGSHDALQALQTVLKREKEVSFQVVEETLYSMVLRILIPRELRCLQCSWCPLTSMPLGSMLKSLIITGDYMLLEVVAAKPSAARELEERGCRIVYSTPTNEADHALTEKQEYALVMAYMHGYYSYPRQISAKELAAKLRVSSSALAELLRKAELKIITRHILEEFPHHLVNLVHTLSHATTPREERRHGEPG